MSKPKHGSVLVTSAVRSIAEALGDFPAKCAIVQSTGAAVRFTVDSDTAPVGGGPGHLIVENQAVLLESAEEIANFQVIRDAGVDATLEITFDPRQRQASNFGDIS